MGRRSSLSSSSQGGGSPILGGGTAMGIGATGIDFADFAATFTSHQEHNIPERENICIKWCSWLSTTMSECYVKGIIEPCNLAWYYLSIFFGYINCFNYITYSQREQINNILQSPIYIVSLLAVVLYLFFGNYISDLYCPPHYQFIFDIISLFAFLILMGDVILRCVGEENYFFIWCCGKNLLHSSSTASFYYNSQTSNYADNGADAGSVGSAESTNFTNNDNKQRHNDNVSNKNNERPPQSGFFSKCTMGSPFFWFDLVSSLTILYFTSWINPARFNISSTQIPLQADASWIVPQTSKQVEVFVFIIGQTLRVSRLVGIMIKYQLYNIQTFTNSKFNPCSNHRLLTGAKKMIFKREHAAITIQRWWRRRYISISSGDVIGQFVIETSRPIQTMPTISDTNQSHTKQTLKSNNKKNTKSSTSQQNAKVQQQYQSRLVLYQQQQNASRSTSEVGSAMRALTAQRVSIGLLFSMICSYVFTFVAVDNTTFRSMVMLHLQTTANPNHSLTFIESARSYSIPELYQYTLSNGTVLNFPLEDGLLPSELRLRDISEIIITDAFNVTTKGLFNDRETVRTQAGVYAIYSAYIIIVWLVGVSAFIGPVMTLVVFPIERMTRLLTMLMVDPLGYQDTLLFKDFEQEGRDFPKKSGWSEEELKGMETTFLLSTILRIGSLMKVGFGSAGVEIIRNSLSAPNATDATFNLDQCGSTTSCVFMFCDIRQFTDATESLQEEVFVFTNKIASVVHSFVSAYGGSANKNVGDAFLVSWQLARYSDSSNGSDDGIMEGVSPLNGLHPSLAHKKQADRALMAVIKIRIALNVDNFYLQELSDVARKRLLEKLSSRPGPVVQIGFGLHAGKAVQGAIGSHRKIDPSYISEAVELSEFLESSTKRYGVSILMSGAFHSLLHQSTATRCRKIDSVLISEPDSKSNSSDDPSAFFNQYKIMDLHTFDVDIDAYWDHKTRKNRTKSIILSASAAQQQMKRSSFSRRASTGRAPDGFSNRSSLSALPRVLRASSGAEHVINSFHGVQSVTLNENDLPNLNNSMASLSSHGVAMREPEVILPSSRVFFSLNDFTSEDMRIMYDKYYEIGFFYRSFSYGLNSFYNRDWGQARKCFKAILSSIDDGPSRYYLKRIDATHGVPPPNFKPYNTMD